MASRAPSDVDASYDVDDIEPGKDITLSVPDVVLDNQEWIVDRAALVFADTFYPVEIDAASWTTARYPVYLSAPHRGRSPAGTDSAITYVLAWAEDLSTDFDIRLAYAIGVIGSGTDSASITSSNTSKIWRALSGDLEIVSAGYLTATVCTLQAQRTAGSGKIWIAGLVVYVA